MTPAIFLVLKADHTCSSYCANGTTFHGSPTNDMDGAWSGGKICWYRGSTLQVAQQQDYNCSSSQTNPWPHDCSHMRHRPKLSTECDSLAHNVVFHVLCAERVNQVGQVECEVTYCHRL